MERLDDSRILSALMTAGSVRGAAAAAGVSESTVRNRLADPGFRRQFDERRGEMLQAATAAMLRKLALATNTLDEIMNDPEASDTARLQAADGLLRHCLRYFSAAELERRIAALESEVQTYAT